MELMVNLNICRVCMKSKKGLTLTSSADLRTKFVEVTKLQYCEDDNMPKEICSCCVSRLKVAYRFLQLAHTSDKSLRSFLTKISNDFQKVTKLNTDTGKDTTKSLTIDDDISTDSQQTEEFTIQIPTSKKRKIEDNPKKALNDRTSESSALEKPPPTIASNTPIQETQEDETAILQQPMDDDEEEEDAESYMVYGDLTFESDLKQVEKQDFDITEIEDDDSQAELEILDDHTEDSQPHSSFANNNSRPIEQSHVFLKEYESMLVDTEDKSIEYVHVEGEDNSTEELRQYQNNDSLPNLNSSAMKIEILHTNSAPLKAVEFDEDSRSSTVQGETLNTIVEVNTSKPKTPSRRPPVRRSAATRNMLSSQKGTKEKVCGLSRFFCSKCNRDFSTRTNLNRHVATHEGKRPYECEICGKGFTQNTSLKQHMYVHTGERPFVCEVCNRGFTQCKSLIFHMRRHTGEKPFPCAECGLFFRQKDGLKTHIMKHHTITSTKCGDTATHICIICKEGLADKDAMDLHMKTHVNNHQIVVTGKNDNPDIMQLIDGDGLFEVKSPELQNSISATAHVVDVMASSASEPSRAKKYQCRKCFKCFALKKSLLRHLSIHDVTFSQLFKCNVCGTAFDSHIEQKQHMQSMHPEVVHPIIYHCKYCEMVCPNRDKLNQHMKLEHDPIQDHKFTCSICLDVNFEYEKDLMEHMLEHEANEMVVQDDEDADEDSAYVKDEA